jgi:hypothetical protein
MSRPNRAGYAGTTQRRFIDSPPLKAKSRGMQLAGENGSVSSRCRT